MTHQSALEQVRIRLERWGDWSRSGGLTNLGYPCKAAHLAERCGGFNDALIQPESVAETDRALVQLKNRHPLLYDVLNEEYYWQSSVAIGSKRLKVSGSVYKSRRLMGEYWIDSRLGDRAHRLSGHLAQLQFA